MKTNKIIHLTLLTTLGVFLIVFGGMDDSPGAQLLGVLTIASGIAYALQKKKSSSKK